MNPSSLRPFLFLLISLVLFGASQWGFARDLVVALTPRSVPFSSLDAEQRPVGFNVDIAEAICRELGRSCELRVLPFPEILPATAKGEVDLGIANHLHTPEREKQVAFTIPYWRSSSSFVARQGVEFSGLAAALQEHVVCHISGSLQERYLRAEAGAAQDRLLAVAAHQDVIDALLAQRCPLALVPTMQILSFLQSEEGRGFDYVGSPMQEGGLGGDVRMIVRPDDPALRDAVDQALKRLISSGEHERISRRYFPFSIL